MPLGLETSFAELRAPRGLNQKKFAHANNEDFPHARLSRARRAHLSGGKGSALQFQIVGKVPRSAGLEVASLRDASRHGEGSVL